MPPRLTALRSSKSPYPWKALYWRGFAGVTRSEAQIRAIAPGGISEYRVKAAAAGMAGKIVTKLLHPCSRSGENGIAVAFIGYGIGVSTSLRG
jgi:hypothetical protein